MQVNFCANFRSNITVSVPLNVWKPCRTLWRQTLALRWVSMIASTTFHNNYNRLTPLVSVFPLVIITRIFHPSSLEIFLCCHMSWVISTSF